MKHFFIYALFLLEICRTVNAMELSKFDGFSLLSQDLFRKIIVMTAEKEIKDKNISEPKQKKALFAWTVYRKYTNVCTFWRQSIASNRDYYTTYIDILPIHFAACTDNLMDFVNLKIDQKAQIYEKDSDGHSIKDYANGRIKFIFVLYKHKGPFYYR